MDAGAYPTNWQTIRLENVLKRISNGLVKAQNKNSNGIPVTRIETIKDEVVDPSHVGYVESLSDEEIHRYSLIDGDILFSHINSESHIGKTAVYIGNPEPLLHGMNLLLLRADKGICEPFFLNYLLKFYRSKGVFIGLAARAVGQASINQGKMKSLEILLPPLAEQRAIARVLRAIQAAREARLRELALERERKAALMQSIFASRSGKIVLLEECALVQTGVTKGRRFDENNGDIIKVPYLRVANVQDGYLDLEEIQTIEIKHSELKRFLLQAGDILLTEGGDFDKLGRGFIWHGQVPQCIHQNHIFAVRVDRELLMPEYFAYLIQSDYGKEYFLSVAHRTTHLACINSTKLKAFPTLIPDLSEQRDIVDVLSACDAKISSLENEVNLHDELFRAMLEELMTGRLSAKPLISAEPSG